MSPLDSANIPEVGQAAMLRGRLATIRAVNAYDTGTQGRLHLVEVQYLDDIRHPESDTVLWEFEVGATILGKTSLPRAGEADPDRPRALRAFVNAHRWTRLNRLHRTGDISQEPLLSVWNSAIQVHAYQLAPVLRALEMPRVSLLLCDGVGIGKTIQAGLVLQEMLLRRRIRRVLILCPALLQRQWRRELDRKFNLKFEIIDSDSTFRIRREMGIDTNPWKTHSRIITSMDYLRIEDVRDQFLQASGSGKRHTPGGNGSAHPSWDLLIVDESHNFAPAGTNRASLRTRLLRDIRFLFEHRIFLSATPHNGNTISFSGLLELLDPVRFQMTAELSKDDKENLNQIRIRRLKDDINEYSLKAPFAKQEDPEQIDIELTSPEQRLFDALREYRKNALTLAAIDSSHSARNVCRFVFSMLTKRLLSCPFAFARTWWRHLRPDEELEEETLFDLAHSAMVEADSELKSDDEKTRVEEDAVRHGTAWLRRKEPALENPITRVTDILNELGYGPDEISRLGPDLHNPEDRKLFAKFAGRSDSKTEKLVQWIKQSLFQDGKLRDDERLIVFTEYKETLLYLQQRLIQEGFDQNTMQLLYGGIRPTEFESVQREFEDPDAAVRLLLATDAASEGINMQNCCRWVIHYDIPWSPTKLLQRNGRVSRYGQFRTVCTYYFHTDQDEDLDFLFRVARKVVQVREDLGSVEAVFDNVLQSHLAGQSRTDAEIQSLIDQAEEADAPQSELGLNTAEEIKESNARASDKLEYSQHVFGVTPDALREVLETAVEVEGNGALEAIPDRDGFYRLRSPSGWAPLVRETLTTGVSGDRMELAFDTACVEEEIGDHRILRLRNHQQLLRLSHPVMRQAMATLSRQLHSGHGKQPIERWSIAALHDSSFEALLVFYYITTAVNELREPMHDEVHSTVFRIDGNVLTPAEHEFAEDVLRAEPIRIASQARLDDWARIFRGKFVAHSKALETYMDARQKEFDSEVQKTAKDILKEERKLQKESYAQRFKELRDRSSDKELKDLAEKFRKLEAQAVQRLLFEEHRLAMESEKKSIEDRIRLLKQDFEQTRTSLETEQKRRTAVIEKRYTLRDARVLPLAMLYLVPATKEDLSR